MKWGGAGAAAGFGTVNLRLLALFWAGRAVNRGVLCK